MKIIDEKGRLFGKINVIDFLIIVLLVVIIPVFFQVYRILGKVPESVPYKTVNVEVVTFVISELADLMKVGDISYDEMGKPVGKITRIIRKSPEYEDKIKNYLKKNDRSTPYEYLMSLFLELELMCTKGTENELCYYQRKNIFVGLEAGGNFIFSTDKYKILCYPLKIGSGSNK